MRKTKRFQIDNREITVKELLVKEIISLGQELVGEKDENGKTVGGLDPTVAGFTDFLERHLTLAVEGIGVQDLTEMAPSDLGLIFDEFKKVNNTFFELAQHLGANKMLSDLGKLMQTEFSNLLADLSKQAMQTA
jgi:hypothetical protein